MRKMSITLRLATEKDAHTWNEIVEREPQGNFFDRFEWCQALGLISKNIKPTPLLIEKDEELSGVFPLCLRRTYYTRYLESLPFSDYGGGSFFRSKQDDYRTELIRKLIEVGKQKNCLRITIRRAFFDDLIEANMIGKPVIVEANNCTFSISLQDEVDNIFRKIQKSRRKGIRRAQERGTIVSEAESLNDVENYYEIYVRTMKRLKASPLPLSFLKNLWNVFEPKGEIKIFLAEYNHKAIAGVLRFIYKKVMYSWGAAFLKEYVYLRPLDLLVWHAIEWSVDHGIGLLDLGSTPNNPSESHFIFKKSWGGQKRILYNYHIILQPSKMKLYKFGNKLVGNIKNILMI